MSLRRLVVDLIAERGCGTVDHLLPALEPMGYTRAQVFKALRNAQSLGFLWCEPASKEGKRPGEARPGVYWPGKKEVDPMYAGLVQRKPEPRRMLVPSVFQLADPMPSEALPRRPGTVYRPMGAWEVT